MTLEDFFRECKKTGATPLNYRSHTETLNGSRTVEYENPDYTKIKKKIAGFMIDKESEDKEIGDLVSRLYGEEVVVHTKDGYHHGTLYGYDGKSFYLGRYLFREKPIDTFNYSINSTFTKEGVVPADNFISVSKIPLKVEKED